jgi:enamine deaminase RidA (YjgF/YER057c/UK114 family)
MVAKIERLAAKGVFDPPAYTQTMKVTGAQAILFISGQVAYDDKGQPRQGDFAAQARATCPEGPDRGGRRHAL